MTKPTTPTKPATFPISDVFLVTEASSSNLGLSYEREVLREDRIGDREERLYQTLRVYENKPEALRAKAVYDQARARLRKVCSKTVLGLVCPVAKEAELADAIADIERTVAEANREFTVCQVDYAVVPIRIQHTNARAQEALRREIQRYGERLVEATQTLDPEAIRRVLRAGRGLDTLVEDAEAREDLEQLGEAARAAARAIGKAIKEADGDEAAARASAPVRAAAEEVLRRFPWAEAFGVAGGEGRGAGAAGSEMAAEVAA